jgi:hypothetical protein
METDKMHVSIIPLAYAGAHAKNYFMFVINITTQLEKFLCKVYIKLYIIYIFYYFCYLFIYFWVGNVKTFLRDISDPCGIVMNYKENTIFVTNMEEYTITKISSTGFLSPFHFRFLKS